MRKNIFESFEDSFLKKLSKEIEDDIRKQIHRILIEGLESAPYSEVNLNSYLKIKSFILFDKVIDIKRYIEEHLNMTYYKFAKFKTFRRENFSTKKSFSKT